MGLQRKKNPDEIVSAGQLLKILNTDAKEVSGLCQRACLKPKKDGFGNIYFSKSDVDILRKVKELYEHTRKLQANIEEDTKMMQKNDINVPIKNFPAKAENYKKDIVQNTAFINKIDALENNLVSKMTDILSEKLDGLDEVIVELIKAKTENEALRQKVNELNKENFALKSENSSFKPVALGLYVKKSADDYTF